MKSTVNHFCAALESASLRDFPKKPFTWTLVTGADFGRSIRWAKKQPNEVSIQIKNHLKKNGK